MGIAAAAIFGDAAVGEGAAVAAGEVGGSMAAGGAVAGDAALVTSGEEIAAAGASDAAAGTAAEGVAGGAAGSAVGDAGLITSGEELAGGMGLADAAGSGLIGDAMASPVASSLVDASGELTPLTQDAAATSTSTASGALTDPAAQAQALSAAQNGATPAGMGLQTPAAALQGGTVTPMGNTAWEGSGGFDAATSAGTPTLDTTTLSKAQLDGTNAFGANSVANSYAAPKTAADYFGDVMNWLKDPANKNLMTLGGNALSGMQKQAMWDQKMQLERDRLKQTSYGSATAGNRPGGGIIGGARK